MNLRCLTFLVNPDIGVNMKFNFFQRGNNEVMGRDVKVAMIQAAPQAVFIYEDVANAINDSLATPENINATLFALTRATGMLLKSLDKVGYPVKDQYDAMLDVWLNDVDDIKGPFDSLPDRFLEYKRICR